MLQQRTFAKVHLVFDLAPVSDDFALHGRLSNIQLFCDVSDAFAVVEKQLDVVSLGIAQMIVSLHIVVPPYVIMLAEIPGKVQRILAAQFCFGPWTETKCTSPREIS